MAAQESSSGLTASAVAAARPQALPASRRLVLVSFRQLRQDLAGIACAILRRGDRQGCALSISIQSCGYLLDRVNMTAETVIYIQKGGVKLSVVHAYGKDNTMAHSIDSKSGKSQSVDTVAFALTGLGARSGEQSGDLQGLSNVQGADSESVEELLEQGNAFEAEVVKGVEDAGDADEGEVHTHEVPQDDVPGEYLDENQCVSGSYRRRPLRQPSLATAILR